MYKDAGIYCGRDVAVEEAEVVASWPPWECTQMQEGLQISETEEGGMSAHCVCCACVKAACASNVSNETECFLLRHK